MFCRHLKSDFIQMVFLFVFQSSENVPRIVPNWLLTIQILQPQRTIIAAETFPEKIEF